MLVVKDWISGPFWFKDDFKLGRWQKHNWTTPTTMKDGKGTTTKG
jgi:hypothetical protein